MANKHQNIDDLFKDKFSNFEAEPPAYVWDGIQANLDAKKGKKKIILWVSLAAAVALMVSFGAGYFISGTNLQNERNDFAQQKGAENNAVHDEATETIAEKNPKLGALDKTSSEETKHSEKALSENISNTNAETAVAAAQHVESAKKAVENKKTTSHHSAVAAASAPAKGALSAPASIQKNAIPSAAKSNNSSATERTEIVENKPSSEVAAKTPSLSEENGSATKQDVAHVDLNNQEIASVPQSREKSSETTGFGKENEQVSIENEQEEIIAKDEAVEDALVAELPATAPSENVVEKRKRMTIKAYFSPIYAMMNTSATQDRFLSATAKEKTFESASEFSYGLGFDLGYEINSNWSLSIGLAYNQIGMSTDRSALQMQKNGGDELPDGFLYDVYTSTGKIAGLTVYQDVNTASTYFNTDVDNKYGNTVRVSQKYGFIEVPIKAQYRHTWGRISVLATAGISTGFLVRNDAYAINEEKQRAFIGQSESMKNVNFNAIVGTGIEVRILPFMSFSLEPMFRYSFINWSNDRENGFKVNPMMLNVNTGLVFKL